MKKIIFLLIIAIAFVGCKTQSNNTEINNTNEFLSRHCHQLEKDFRLILKGNESKAEYYQNKLNNYNIGANSFKSYINNMNSKNKDKVDEMINDYLKYFEQVIPISESRDLIIKETKSFFLNNHTSSRNYLLNKFLIANSIVYNELYKDFNKADFKFDFVKAEVNMKQSSVTLGDSIEFNIYLQAYNTFINRSIIIGVLDSNNQFTEIIDTINAFDYGNNGIIKYKLKTKNKGDNYLMGKVIYFNQQLPFRYRYKVE